MLLRKYEDRWGMKVELNLEAIAAVIPECSEEEWEGKGLDLDAFGNVPVTVHFGGSCFATTRKVYLEMLDELAKQDCKCAPCTDGQTECDNGPTIPVFYAKRVIMGSEYMDANTKMRLLADLDIFM